MRIFFFFLVYFFPREIPLVLTTFCASLSHTYRDANRMAANVSETIVKILAESDHPWGESPEKQAAEYVQSMRDSHRFVLDVWG